MRFNTIVLAGLIAGSTAIPVAAQTSRGGSTTVYRSSSDDNDRAALGVNTTASGRRDTLGLLVQSVVAESPAEKAGIEEGNRLVSINGVSLQLSRSDAGEDDMNGTMTRRLVRELRKVTPGSDVDLKVYANGQTKTVKVKTTDVEELGALERRASRRSRTDDEDRAVVGLNFGGGGSKRDTLGVFVASITEDGPAAKAGLEEGNRIASINGQDLRVTRDDAGDRYMADAKANRFRRVMRSLKPGDVVDLRVYTNGQYRNIKVTTASAEDLYRENNRGFRIFNGEAGNAFTLPRTLMPMTPHAPVAPMIRGRTRMTIDNDEFDFLDDDMRIAIEGAVEAAGSALKNAEPVIARAAAEAERAAYHALQSLQGMKSMEGMKMRMPRSATMLDEDDRCKPSNSASASQWREIASNASDSRSFNASGFGATYTLEIPGLCVTKVNADLASYFGQGAERGLLVLQADTPFDDLRAGDILLTVNGKAVRSGDNGRLNFNADAENRIEYLRKGEKKSAIVQIDR